MTANRILYVEDEEDIRDTITMLLEHEGYHVNAVPTAEQALEELARARFDLLLTDYQLPGENAAWLLHSASERGVLQGTPVIVLTATNHPSGIDGCRVLCKPISIEALLAAFDEVMPASLETLAAAKQDAEVRLRLYISGTSQVSRKAQRNLKLALHGIDPSCYEIVIYDIGDPDGSWAGPAEEDRVVVTPTLVRVGPLPRVWIAGDLSNVEVVREAIVPGSLQPPR